VTVTVKLLSALNAAGSVSASTVYKHFENNDSLIETALTDAFENWEAWVSEVLADISDPLEQLVKPMRLFFRIPVTHPRYARMIAKNMYQTMESFPTINDGLRHHIKELSRAGLLKIDNVDTRTENMLAVLARAIQSVLADPKNRPESADLAVQLALPLIGITPAKAKALMTKSLPVEIVNVQSS
jgi:AcrR family transcriptional regulator